MTGTVLMVYDVEMASKSTRDFLEGAQELHQKYDVPWTIYLAGQTVEARAEDIKCVTDDPLLTIAQHTYNHAAHTFVYHLKEFFPGFRVNRIISTFPGQFLGRLQDLASPTSKLC